MNTSIEQIASTAKLLGKKLGVVSTVSVGGAPESAFVYFIIDDALNVYFATRAGSRKYKNLMQNPRAAFVIASEHPPQTIQIEGDATVVTDANEQQTLLPDLIKMLSEGGYVRPMNHMMDSELVFMKISPTWARFGDFEVVREEGAFREVSV